MAKKIFISFWNLLWGHNQVFPSVGGNTNHSSASHSQYNDVRGRVGFGRWIKHEKKRQGMWHCMNGSSRSDRKHGCLSEKLYWWQDSAGEKNHLDTTDKHPKQTLLFLGIFLSQDPKDTVLFLFSDQQSFHPRQAVRRAPCHLQQLPPGHMPQSSCCFTCVAMKNCNSWWVLHTIYSIGASSSVINVMISLFPVVVHFQPLFSGLNNFLSKNSPQAQF